jgi:hypothetical protein
MRAEQIRSNGFARWKNVQFFQIYDRIRHAKRVMKTALWHATVQRHLAAFKSTPAGITAAGLLTLVTGTRSLSEFRAHAPADAHLAVPRALRRPQIRQAGDYLLSASSLGGFAAA